MFGKVFNTHGLEGAGTHVKRHIFDIDALIADP